MRARLHFSMLIAASLLLAAAHAHASSRPLPKIPEATVPLLKDASDMTNKHVAQPDDPGVDCVREVTGADKQNALDADYRGSTGSAAKNLKNCLPQSDAFRRAGEAAAYLGHYYTNFTPFAAELRAMSDDKRHEFHESIRECVTNQPSCDDKKRSTLLRAMVQYNFGKELKAQVLENNTRAERMKSASLDLSAADWKSMGATPQRVMTHKGSLRTGSLRTTTFRLDAKADYVFDWSKASAEQRAVLGANFMNEYRSFVDVYSKTTAQQSRWHYVPAKSSALMGTSYVAQADYRNQDPRTAGLAVNRGRHDADIRSQNTQAVNEIVQNYKEALHRDGIKREKQNADGDWVEQQVAWREVHPNDILTNDTGFGLIHQKDPKTGQEVDPKTIARGLVLSINKAIVDAEEAKKQATSRGDQRVPSSTGSSAPPPTASNPKTIPSVSVDVEKFDQFLDAIWPADVAKPRG